MADQIPPYNVGDLAGDVSGWRPPPRATSCRSATSSRTGCRRPGPCSKSPAAPASMRSPSPSLSRPRLAAERSRPHRACLDCGMARRWTRQPSPTAAHRRRRARVADRARGRDPVHQHGPHQPVDERARAARWRGSPARRGRSADPLRPVDRRGDRDRAVQPGVRRRPQGARSRDGDCARSTSFSPRQSGAG